MKALRITFAVIFVVPILVLSPLYAFFIAYLMEVTGMEKAAQNHLRRCGSFIGSAILFFLGVKLVVTGRRICRKRGKGSATWGTTRACWISPPLWDRPSCGGR